MRASRGCCLWLIPPATALACLLAADPARAATSSRSVGSPAGGNGSTITTDGRLVVVARGDGWNAMVLRPQNVQLDGGLVDVNAVFSPPYLVQPASSEGENALALCEPPDAPPPYRCNADGDADGGGA